MRYERVLFRDVLCLCLAWAILGAILWAECGQREQVSAKEVKIVRQVKPIYDEDRLTGYVYKHSYRISKGTAREIVQEAMKTRCPILLLAIMQVESSFNPAAVSKAGARGLGQVMPVKALKQAHIVNDYRDLFNVETNIKAMDYIFKKKLAKAKGDYKRAIGYYFGRYNDKYVNKVLDAYFELLGGQVR